MKRNTKRYTSSRASTPLRSVDGKLIVAKQKSEKIAAKALADSEASANEAARLTRALEEYKMKCENQMIASQKGHSEDMQRLTQESE